MITHRKENKKNGKRNRNKKIKKLHNTLEITSIELAERLKECDIVLIPCGSHERHGRHLPLGTDTYHSIQLTKLAAEKADVFYTPPLWMGYSPHHMRRPGEGTGTITLRADTLRRVYYDVARDLIYHGFNKVVFVICHGSNIKVMDEVLRKLRYETGAFVAAYFEPLERDNDLIKDLLKSPPEDIPTWHASEAETSMIMADYPELVRMEYAVKDFAHAPKWLTGKFSKIDGNPRVSFEGVENIFLPMEHYEYSDSATIGNPFTATPEEGRALIDRMSTHLTNFAKEIKKIKVKVKTREFNERAW